VADWGLPCAVALPFAAGLVAVVCGRVAGRWAGIGMLAAALASFTIVAALALGAGEPPVFTREWIPTLGIELRFRADGFGAFFALLVSGIGALVAIYAIAYLDELPKARLGRFFAALAAFMGAMLGIALADDLFLLFVFWEITRSS
jgi:multicomponent Na+:H+ antiporter subunit A